MMYRLRSTTEIIDQPDASLRLVPASGTEDILIATPNAPHRFVLDALKTARDPVELARRAAQKHEVSEQDVLTFIDDLAVSGVLTKISPVSPLSPDELERYDRQLAYFETSRTLPVDAHLMQQKLRDSHVAVVGAGGVGGLAVVQLAVAGVGRLSVIDDDIVELSNLSRQIVFDESDVGSGKAETVATRARQRNRLVSVEPHSERISSAADLSKVLRGGVSVLLLAGDEPADQLPMWVDDACQSAAVPYVTLSNVPPVIRVGPTVIPGRTPCWRCFRDDARARYAGFDLQLAQVGSHPSRSAATVWSLSIAVGIAVQEIVALLLEGTAATEGTSIFLDTVSLVVEKSELPRVRCRHHD